MIGETTNYIQGEIRYFWEYKYELLIAALYSFGVFGYLINKFNKHPKPQNISSNIWYSILFIVAISYMVASNFSPFIYFQF